MFQDGPEYCTGLDTGTLHKFQPMEFELRFEHFPIWMLVLHPSFISKVYIPHYESSLQFLSNPKYKCGHQLLRSMCKQLNHKLIFGQVNRTNVNFILVSGSQEFIEREQLCVQSPAIGIIDVHYRSHTPNNLMNGCEITHKMVDGCTTFRTWMWITDKLHFPELSNIRRPVSAFMEFGRYLKTNSSNEAFILENNYLSI